MGIVICYAPREFSSSFFSFLSVFPYHSVSCARFSEHEKLSMLAFVWFECGVSVFVAVKTMPNSKNMFIGLTIGNHGRVLNIKSSVFFSISNGVSSFSLLCAYLQWYLFRGSFSPFSRLNGPTNKNFALYFHRRHLMKKCFRALEDLKYDMKNQML